MKRTTAILPLALVLAACAGQANTNGNGQAKPGGSAGPVSERQLIVQAGYFDVGTLSASPPAIPAQVDKLVLGGVEMVARPFVIECVVDPRNRGPEKVTKIVVDATLTDAGVDHKVTGQNLTPTGVACITAALGKFTAASPGLNAKAAVQKPVAAHLEITHTVGESPSVVLGTNEASDISAVIRLALPGWGDCLGDWKSAPPRTLKASVKLGKPKVAAPEVAPTEVLFEPAGDPTADKVAACLKTKVMALKFKAPKEDSLAVPHTFRFVHSGIADMALPGTTSDLMLAQIELQRIKLEADQTIVDAERQQAWKAYNAAVDGYKASSKDPKAPKVEVIDLINKCKELLAEDDKLIDTLQKVSQGEDTAHKLIAEQKAKDPTWAPIEANAARQLAEAQKVTETMRNNRKLDENACPKVH